MKLRLSLSIILSTLALLRCGGATGPDSSGGAGGGSGLLPNEPVCPGAAATPPAPVAHVCEAGEVIPLGGGPLTTRDSLRGTNGTFVDHCEACDTLVTYECETVTDDPCDDICETTVTGVVLKKVVTCTCADGRCLDMP